MTITETAGRVDQRTRVATETVPVDHDSAGMNGLTLRRGWYLPVKSILERLAAAILLILAVPIMFAMGVLIKLTSRGPVFYVQTRVGKHGRQFQMIKLRTMVRDAEKQTGPVWATQGDPRITPLGRLLRDTHLDELPQLLNVVAGHMSLIGPRPERPSFVAEFAARLPHYLHRLDVKPGITGLAQLQLPPDTDLSSVRSKLAHDLYYIQFQGPRLDLQIAVGTIWLFGNSILSPLYRCVMLPSSEFVRAQMAHAIYGQDMVIDHATRTVSPAANAITPTE